MTREARQSWEKARAELAALRGGNDEDFVDLQDPIAEREYHWDRFCHLSASIDAGYTLFEHPGTMAPMIYAGVMARLTKWRIKDMERLKS